MKQDTAGNLFDSLTHYQVNEAKFLLKTSEGFWTIGLGQARLLEASLVEPPLQRKSIKSFSALSAQFAWMDYCLRGMELASKSTALRKKTVSQAETVELFNAHL